VYRERDSLHAAPLCPQRPFHTYIYTHTYIYIYRERERERRGGRRRRDREREIPYTPPLCARSALFIYIYVHTHMCIYVYIYMYIYTYIHTYIHRVYPREILYTALLCAQRPLPSHKLWGEAGSYIYPYIEREKERKRGGGET